MAFAVALLLAACASEREPAQQKLEDIDAVMRAVAADAARFAPAEYAEAERQRAELKFSYDQKDYAAVVRSAPAVMSAIDRLAAGVARERDAQKQSLGGEWSKLGRTVPGLLAAIKGRVAAIAAGTGDAEDADVGASQTTAADAEAQWDAARAAFAAGKGEEAIAIARELQVELETQARLLHAGGSEAAP